MGIEGLGRRQRARVLADPASGPPPGVASPPRARLGDDRVESKPATLGGSPRPPSGAVELPALGGRARPQTFAGEWSRIEAAIREAKPASLEAAIGMLGGLGFSVKSAKGDRAKLESGGFEVELQTRTLGSQSAIRVELEGPEKKGGERVDRTAYAMSGTLVPKKLFSRMEDKFEDVTKAFEDALEAHGKKPLPTTFDQLKAFIGAGRSEKAQAKDAVEDAEVAGKLDALTQQLESLMAKGLAPKSIVVYTDGPDGAGKSSTGTIVLQAIAKAGYDTDAVSFKAPSAEEKAQHWLQRFRDRGLPSGEHTARFWDRGPAGDAVYGDKSAAEAKVMAKEVRAFERSLADDGVLLFKVHVFADQDKQAETFGKRFARQAAADRIEVLLEGRGKLTEAAQAALDNIRGKVDGDDLRALVGYEEFQARFSRFSKAAGYHVIDASDRHGARLDIIDALSEELAAFAARAKA